VPVTRKTVSQVERELQGKLNAKFLKSAHVSVMVKEYNNSRVTIMGAIKSQSVQSLRGPTTLLQVIAQAGGTDRETASTNVVVFQNADGQRTAIRYDLNDINTGKVADPPVQAGDVIVIEDSALKSSWNVVKQALPFTGIASLMVAL
jgi:polysaccharide export outer membrane protein